MNWEKKRKKNKTKVFILWNVQILKQMIRQSSKAHNQRFSLYATTAEGVSGEDEVGSGMDVTYTTQTLH